MLSPAVWQRLNWWRDAAPQLSCSPHAGHCRRDDYRDRDRRPGAGGDELGKLTGQRDRRTATRTRKCGRRGIGNCARFSSGYARQAHHLATGDNGVDQPKQQPGDCDGGLPLQRDDSICDRDNLVHHRPTGQIHQDLHHRHVHPRVDHFRSWNAANFSGHTLCHV